MALRILALSERAFVARSRLRHAPRPEIAPIDVRFACKSTVASVQAPYVSPGATTRRCVHLNAVSLPWKHWADPTLRTPEEAHDV